MKKPSSNISNIKKICKPLLGPKRVAFQWCCSLVILGIPFVPIGDDSLLRLDIKSLSLYALGKVFPITDLSLFLILSIALVMLFLLVTMAFGRAWCGWACPQTTLVDVVEWFARKIGIKVRAGTFLASRPQKMVLHGLYLLLGVLVGCNLTWYFISPYEFFPTLLRAELDWPVLFFIFIITATIYLDLALLRRLFCKEFCPYGRFQTVLIDSGTLTLHYHPEEAPRCISCGACVRACPTGIDIRRGYQIECINCGRCLDACREVMARRNQPGIIRYTFGLEGKGIPALLNIRMALVGLVFFSLCGGLILATLQRSDVSIRVGRNQLLLPRYVDNHLVANFYTVFLTNRTNGKVEISLALDNPQEDITMTGATNMKKLAPGEKIRFDIALEAGQETLVNPRPVNIDVVGINGKLYESATIFLTKPRQKNDQQ